MTGILILLAALVVADAGTTAYGFHLGAYERTPGYRRLPRWAVPTLRLVLCALGVVLLWWVAGYGDEWETAAAFVAFLGIAVAVFAVASNVRVIQRLRARAR